MLAIDLAVRSVEEGGGVEDTVALEAAHAVLVERPCLSSDPLRLKNFASTTNASIRIIFLAFNFVFLSESVLSSGSPEFAIAHLDIVKTSSLRLKSRLHGAYLAVDFIVRSLDCSKVAKL